MKLERFKEKDNKKTGIVIFTIVCILLVSGAILYRTFAIFEVKTNQNVIHGTVQDPGNLYFAFYVDNEIQKDMPQKNGEYIFDEDNSYCGVTGVNEHDENIQLEFDKERWSITVLGLKTSRTKCNLKFVSGAYILDKPVKAVTSGDGLYKVTHGEEVSGTLNDADFKQTEWRFAGINPNNYITFNNETWRIIGLVNVMTGENTVEQRVKIVKTTPLAEKKMWDSNKSNDWTQSSLMKYLNIDYYNEANIVIADTLQDTTSKKMIDEGIIWNLGSRNSSQDATANMFYKSERSKTVDDNLSATWPRTNDNSIAARIGLIYPSDYGYATSGGTYGREKCYEYSLNNWNATAYGYECMNSDWLKPNDGLTWTMTYRINSVSNVLVIDARGNLGDDYSGTNNLVFPVIYLQTNVKIINDKQDGSDSKPYHIQQIS